MTDTMCLEVGTFSFVLAVTPCKTQPPEQKPLRCRVYNPGAMITRKQLQPARRTPWPGRAGPPRSAWLTLSPTLLLAPCSPFQPGPSFCPGRVRHLLPSGCVSSRSFSAGGTVGNCSLGAQAPDALALGCFEINNRRRSPPARRCCVQGGRAGGHARLLSVEAARDGAHGAGWTPESPAAAYSSFVLSSAPSALPAALTTA